MHWLTMFVVGALLLRTADAQSPFSTQWNRGYGSKGYYCRPESAVVVEGDLWLICDGHDYSAKKQAVTVYRIDGNSGELKFATELKEFERLVFGVEASYLITAGRELHNESFRVLKIQFK